MSEQHQPPIPEMIPRTLFISLGEDGNLEVKTRLVLTAPEVAHILTVGTQKVRWMMLRHELPSFHLGTRRVVTLNALERYVREREVEEQQNFLDALKRYYGYGYFSPREPHPEIQRAQERLNAMQQLPEESGAQGQERAHVPIEAALYAITITQSGQLECTPRWLLSFVCRFLGARLDQMRLDRHSTQS